MLPTYPRYLNGLEESSVVLNASKIYHPQKKSEMCLRLRALPFQIKYRQTPNGQVTAEANHPSVQNAVAELEVCRQAVKTVSHNTQQNIQQTQQQVYNTIEV